MKCDGFSKGGLWAFYQLLKKLSESATISQMNSRYQVLCAIYDIVSIHEFIETHGYQVKKCSIDVAHSHFEVQGIYV